MRKIIFLCFLSFVCFISQAQQIIELPEMAEQTHQELSIVRIGLYKDSTVIDLSVENKLEQGGWFCADKNIYIENPMKPKRFSLIKSYGIPSCPSTHRFSKVGEQLNFSLVFPGIPSDTKRLHLVENCDNACFAFRDIILDEKLNRDIKLCARGVKLYETNNIHEALGCFKKVIEVLPESPTHVYGYSYYNLVKIYFSIGEKETARVWFNQLEKSNLPDKQHFINTLMTEGFLPK